MNILIIGSGAREHAIAKSFRRSPQNPTLFCCASSNNPGIHALTNQYWIGDYCEINQVVTKAKEWKIDFAIIGPEAPLEQGLADALWESNIPTIGPKKFLAQIETSKAFTRN
ncbi:MAG: phosphoribosylamine--glycine ligase, partial [Gammaproteobacteria bacterium]